MYKTASNEITLTSEAPEIAHKENFISRRNAEEKDSLLNDRFCNQFFLPPTSKFGYHIYCNKTTILAQYSKQTY